MDSTDEHDGAVAAAEEEPRVRFAPSAVTEPDADLSQQLDERLEERADLAEALKVAGEHGANSKMPAPSEDQQIDALDYFLAADTPDEGGVLRVDVGVPGDPKVIYWRIKAVDSETLRMIRQTSQGNRRMRRSRVPGEPEIDNQEANARIVVAGSVYPDFNEIVRLKMENVGEKQQIPDPLAAGVLVLKNRLRHRPGLIDQISEHILVLSGFDEDAVQHHAVGKA